MKIVKLNEKHLSLRERFAKKMNEGAEDEIPETGAEETPETEGDGEGEGEGEVTITLSPDDVAVLQKIIGMVDGEGAEPEGDGETCPGCDDPNCPDCNPDGAGDDAPVEDDGSGEFEVPDLSGLEDTRDDDEMSYFA